MKNARGGEQGHKGGRIMTQSEVQEIVRIVDKAKLGDVDLDVLYAVYRAYTKKEPGILGLIAVYRAGEVTGIRRERQRRKGIQPCGD